MRHAGGRWPASATVEQTLPGEYYTACPFFHREMERIWFNTWLCAGRAEQIPEKGDFFTRQVGDESVVVVRGREGGIGAFYNVCRHRGSRLCTDEAGNLKSGLIRCPYHSWTYDATHGALVSAPNIPDGTEGFDKARFPLFSLRVEMWEGFIWVNFDCHAAPLRDVLGLPSTYSYYERYHAGDLKIGKLIAYDVDANWKVIMENGMECYHCSHIHPELSRCTPPMLPRQWVHQELPESKVFKHSGGGMPLAPGFEAVNLDGRPRRPRFRDLADEDTHAIYYAFVYPHMLLGFAPDYVFFFTVWPLAVNKTKVWAYWLFDPAAMVRGDFDPSDAVEFWDITNRQDWRACELAQLGSQSRVYRTGGALVPFEWMVNQFRRYILAEMQDGHVARAGGGAG